MADHPMAKRDVASVKIDADVIRDAKIAAAFENKTLTDYLSEILRPRVSHDIEKGYTKRSKGPKGKAKGDKQE